MGTVPAEGFTAGIKVVWIAKWLLKGILFLAAWLVLNLVGALSPRMLIRFMPASPHYGTFDSEATWIACLGPMGWVVGLMVFGLALVLALILRRQRWWLRMIVAASPLLLAMYRWFEGDLHDWLRPLVGTIFAVELLLVALAAIFCRKIAEVAGSFFVSEQGKNGREN